MTLLKTPQLKSLYNDAYAYANRENPSIEFWVAVLNHFLPPPRWNHAREFAPDLDNPQDLRRMDIVSRKFDTKQSRYFYSGILEGKRPNYGSDDVRTVEEQLHEYSYGYLDSCDEKSLWGFTTLGTRIRFWFYNSGDSHLTSYYPQTTLVYTDALYIDANTPDTTELENAFKYIQDHPWPTKKTRGVSPDVPTQPPRSNPFSGPIAPAPVVLTSHPSTAAKPGYTSMYTVPSSSYNTVPSFSYTVPILQQDPGSVHSSPSEQGSSGDGSKEPSLPANAICVEVQVEPKKRGDLYHFDHNGNHYTIGEGDWVECVTEHTGARYDCVAYWGSGLCFYTWNLRDLQIYEEFVPSSPQASASDYQAPSNTAMDSSTQDTQQDPKILIVTVREEKHRTSKDEIIFQNRRGKDISTLRSDWAKVKYNGKTAWQHEGKHHTYICFDKVIDQ